MFLSFLLKPNGCLKVVLPAHLNGTLETFFHEELHLRAVQKNPPAKYSYKPSSCYGRAHPEVFLTLENSNQSSLQVVGSNSLALLNMSDVHWGGTFIDDLSATRLCVRDAIADFSSCLNLARKLMESVWIRGSYVAALLIQEACVHSRSKIDLAYARHNILLYVLVASFCLCHFL